MSNPKLHCKPIFASGLTIVAFAKVAAEKACECYNRTTGGRDLWSIPMAIRPFVSQLSVVTAYIAIAFVGAIVLGVF